MGKVYEAAQLTEQAFAAKAGESFADVQSRGGQDHVDFIRYSIEMPSTLERDHPIGDVATKPVDHIIDFRAENQAALEMTRIDPHLTAINEFEPAAADEFNKLAMRLIAASEEQPLKRILIASAEHGDGRTTVLLNLAAALARANRRVLVMDTDLMRPSVLRMLGLEAHTGLSDVVVKRVPPTETAIKVNPCGFIVMPSRERADAAILASQSFRALLLGLDSHFDFLLFDSGPLLSAADPGLLVRLTDTTLLVVQSGKTSSGQMAKAISSLNQNKVFGVVLNRAK
ncbi:MAG TPA: CpsD/CapB family tyrosine-protein kinase [Blastocatellia bacterium]|nr:CpsD/CapB family tyrosine-protein kinase [Blastocatellia bacterium]